jgi:hypothetical protein
MFRNRGRHVVSADGSTLQDRGRYNVDSAQYNENNDHHAEQSSSNSPERSLNNSGGNSSPAIPNQSSGAPPNEKECSNRNTDTCHAQYAAASQSTNINKVLDRGCSVVSSNSNDNGECASRNETIMSQLNAQNLGLTQQTQDKDETDSTVSIMGSIINDDLDDEDSLKKMDLVRWKSTMKMYRSSNERMLDVKENDEHTNDVLDETDIGNEYENECTLSEVWPTNEQAEPKVANSELQQVLLNDTITSDAENVDNLVNISMECHVDTSHFLDESQITNEDHDDNDNVPHSNVVMVADFSGIESGSSDLEDLVADESVQKKDTISLKNGSGKEMNNTNHSPNHASSVRVEQESPLRAAFRRTENNIRRMTSPRLPPSHYETVDRKSRVQSNSVLPLPLQLARKCFSFDDTTLDEDLAIPYQPQLALLGQDSPKRRLPRDQMSHHQSKNTEYYGLSAVASFPYEDENSLKQAIPLKRTSKSYSGSFGHAKSHLLSNGQPYEGSGKDEHSSPCRVIQQSKTWDHAVANHQSSRVVHRHHPTCKLSHIQRNAKLTQQQQQQLQQQRLQLEVNSGNVSHLHLSRITHLPLFVPTESNKHAIAYC